MTHFRTETFKNYLPDVAEFTGSAVEEILAQVEAPAAPLALFGPAQPQSGPGHHLRLPKRTATRKFIFIFNGFRYSSGVAEITQQVLSVERSLVRADELEYFGIRHRSHLVFFHHRGSCSHGLPVSAGCASIVSEVWKPKVNSSVRSRPQRRCSSTRGRPRVAGPASHAL